MDLNKPLDYETTDGLKINGQTKGFLRETAKWAQFLSILGFAIIGLLTISIIGIGSTFRSFPESSTGFFGPQAIFVYILFIAVLFFPVFFLFRFSSNMLRALDSNNQSALVDSFSNLKSHYRYLGILTIIVIILYITLLANAFL